MNGLKLLLCSVAVVAFGSIAHAQVVQLPTFHSFSVSTTVSVPDRGAAYLGGVTRGSWGRSSRGVPGLRHVPGVNRLFTNRGIGSSVSSSHAYATATIIDHAEIDRKLLAEASARRGGSPVVSATDKRAAYLTEFVSRHPHEETPKEVRPLQQTPTKQPTTAATRIAAAKATQQANLQVYVERAERAEETGRIGSARCCYNVLLRRGNEEQKLFAVERLAALASPPPIDKIASVGD